MGKRIVICVLSLSLAGATWAAERTDVDRGREALGRGGSIVARINDGELVKIVQDSATAFEVLESASDGPSTRLLVQRVGADESQQAWRVTFQSGDDVVASDVTFSESALAVSGSINRTRFVSSSVYLDDVIFVNRTFDEIQVSAELYPADRTDPRNELGANRIRAYEEAVAAHPVWAELAADAVTMAGLAEQSGYADIVSRVVELAVSPLESSSVSTRSIQSYMGCLESACHYDGGCWGGGGCHGCAGDSVAVQLAAFALYEIDAELCFVRHIINPIKW